jgi:hypothetical protein
MPEPAPVLVAPVLLAPVLLAPPPSRSEPPFVLLPQATAATQATLKSPRLLVAIHFR